MPRRLAHLQNGVVEQISEGADDDAQHQAWLAAVADDFDTITDVTGLDVDRGHTWTATEGFRPPQPYPSWSWSAEDEAWAAPVAAPEPSSHYSWDEQSGSWLSR